MAWMLIICDWPQNIIFARNQTATKPPLHMTAQLNLYEEIAELLATMSPQKVVALKAPEARQKRLAWLLEKNRESGLDELEKNELDRFLLFNQIVTLAKIRAKRLLTQL